MKDKDSLKTLWQPIPFSFVDNKDYVQAPTGNKDSSKTNKQQKTKLLKALSTKKSLKRKMKAPTSSRIRVKITKAMQAMTEAELQAHLATTENQVNRTLKLRLYPNQTQSGLLIRWMGHARYWYNKVVEDYRFWKAQEQSVPDWKRRLITLFSLRELRQTRIQSCDPRYHWYDKSITRNEVIDAAMENAIEHRKETISRNMEFYRGHNHHGLSFKSKKQPKQTITIRQREIKDGIQPYSSFLYNKDTLNPNSVSNLTRPKSQTPRQTFLPQPLHPGHVEHRKLNHHWPNEEGIVSADSSITYRRHLGTFTFNWSYTKQRISPSQARSLRVTDGMKQQTGTKSAGGDDTQIPCPPHANLVCNDHNSRVISMDP